MYHVYVLTAFGLLILGCKVFDRMRGISPRIKDYVPVTKIHVENPNIFAQGRVAVRPGPLERWVVLRPLYDLKSINGCDSINGSAP